LVTVEEHKAEVEEDKEQEEKEQRDGETNVPMKGRDEQRCSVSCHIPHIGGTSIDTKTCEAWNTG